MRRLVKKTRLLHLPFFFNSFRLHLDRRNSFVFNMRELERTSSQLAGSIISSRFADQSCNEVVFNPTNTRTLMKKSTSSSLQGSCRDWPRCLCLHRHLGQRRQNLEEARTAGQHRSRLLNLSRTSILGSGIVSSSSSNVENVRSSLEDLSESYVCPFPNPTNACPSIDAEAATNASRLERNVITRETIPTKTVRI